MAKKRIPPSKTTEFHPPFMNFMGPGTNLMDRLGLKRKGLSHLPLTRGDRVAFEHDLFYSSTSSPVREYADRAMINQIAKLKKEGKLSIYDDKTAWGILPVRDYRRIKDFYAPGIKTGLATSASLNEFSQFLTGLNRLVKTIPSFLAGGAAPARTLYTQLFGRRGLAPPHIREAVRSYLGEPRRGRGAGRRFFWSEFFNLIPYLITGGLLAVPAIEGMKDIIKDFDDLQQVYLTSIRDAPEIQNEMQDVLTNYDAYLDEVGYYDDKGYFQLKEDINEEDARQKYIDFFAEYRDYVGYINSIQDEKYELPRLNKLDIKKASSPNDYKDKVIIPMPSQKTLNIEDKDFIEEIEKIQKGDYPKPEVIKQPTIEEPRPEEPIPDTEKNIIDNIEMAIGKTTKPLTKNEMRKLEVDYFLMTQGYTKAEIRNMKPAEKQSTYDAVIEEPFAPVYRTMEKMTKEERLNKMIDELIRTGGVAKGVGKDDLVYYGFDKIKKLYEAVVKKRRKKLKEEVEEGFTIEPVEPVPEPPPPEPGFKVEPEQIVETTHERTEPEGKTQNSLTPFKSNITAQRATQALPSQEEQLKDLTNWQMFDQIKAYNDDGVDFGKQTQDLEEKNMSGPLSAWYDFTRRQYEPVRQEITEGKTLNEDLFKATFTDIDQEAYLDSQNVRGRDVFEDVTANPLSLKFQYEADINGTYDKSPYNTLSVANSSVGDEKGRLYADLKKNLNLFIVE